MMENPKSLNYCSSVYLPPQVCGDVQFVLSIKGSDLQIQEEFQKSNYLMTVTFWGSTSCYPITLNNNKESVKQTESTIFSISCSLEQLSNYWRDSRSIYFELINFDDLQPIGFGILDTSEFDSFQSGERIEESLTIYSMSTGFRIGQVSIVLFLLPYSTISSTL